MPAQGALPTTKTEIGLGESTLVLFAGAVLLLGAVLWSARGPLAEKTDFSVTYVGAWMVHQGQGASLYDLSEQKKVRDSLFQHPNPLIYEHPPFEALLFAPLAGLPYRTAYLIWGMVNAMIWLTLPLLLRPYAPFPSETLGYFALWFLFAPLGVALFQGQPSLLLVLLYAATFISLKGGRDLRAGMFLGLGLFKFQFVLPFALIFLLRRKRRFLGGFACSAAVLGALSLIAAGWRGILSYVRLLLSIGSKPANQSYGSAVDMPTLQGFVYAVLGNRVSVGTISFIVAVSSVLLVFLTAWRWRREERRSGNGSFDLMFAAALAVSLMTGFHMFTHDFAPLILAALLVLAHFPKRERSALRFALGATLVLLWLPPLYFALVALHRLYLMFPVLLVFGLSALSLAARPVEEVRRERARVPAQ